MSEENEVIEGEIIEEVKEQDNEQGKEQVNDPNEPEGGYEQAAKDMGWNPDYDGPHKRSAKEFYERGVEIQPILRKNLEGSQKKVKDLEERLNKQTDQFGKALTAVQSHLNKQYEAKLADIQAQKKDAVKNADPDEYDRLEQQEKALEKPAEITPDPVNDPVFDQWVSDNLWMNEDYERSAYAESIGPYVKRTNPHLSGRAYLDEVTKHVKEKFPEKFNNPRRATPSPSSPRPPVQDKEITSFDELPQEAKEAYAMITRTVKMSKDEYVKEYEAAQ